MTPPTPEQRAEYLDPPCDTLQRAMKKVRRWKNQGHATERDAADLQQALDLVRGVMRRHGLHPIDRDGRRERAREDRVEDSE